MLKVRDAQMAALARDRRERFVRRSVEHVRAAFPAAFAEHGRAGVEASVRTAMEKSDVYGLPSERDVLRYLNLMYALGFELDSDSRMPWAAEVLANPRYDGSVKLDLLAVHARRWLDARAREAR